MKPLLYILLPLLLVTTNSCNGDDDSSDDTLPEVTTIGANTAGCLVNGEVFLPKGNSFGGPTLSAFYQVDQDGFHFGLSISDTTGDITKSIAVFTNPEELQEGQTYSLGAIEVNEDNDFNSNFGRYIEIDASVVFFNTSSTSTGVLTITKLDTQQNIISGTFSFDAINNSGEVVEVRDGRFDMRYTN